MACPLRPLDAQQIPPVCVCCRCGDELYETEECYLIDEEVICPSCRQTLFGRNTLRAG